MKNLARIIAIVVAIVAAAGAAWWFTMRSQPASAPPASTAAAQDSPPFALSGRLVIEAAAPGDAALGVIRLFDQRARNGFSQGGTPVAISRAAIDAGIALEIEQPNGTGNPGTKPVVVRAPADGPQQVQADTTIEIVADLPALPAAGSRVRVSLPIGGATVVTDWVDVPPAPTSQVEALVSRARAQRVKGDAALAATAAQLIAAAPADARGYYFRGLALDSAGDRAGAITAYEAALERIPPDGPEPPAGLYSRLARLRAQ